MLRITELKLPLDHVEAALPAAIIARLAIKPAELLRFTVFRRGYDSRKKANIELVYTLDVELATAVELATFKRFKRDVNIVETPDTGYKFVASNDALANRPLRPVVIGFGPCGIFAALILAQMGLNPIILERGKVVRERTKDTWGLWRKRELNPESNVQFGEGGAGTFSDGKLWSQVKDPKHYGRKVLHEFVKAGAPDEILYVSKPHIGTFRLVKMVEHMREQIVALGGEFRFEARVTDVLIENGQMRGVTLANGEHIASNHVVLAIGHSARDTFQMLFDRGVYIEAKPFSLGFRIEHPQSIVDRARFGPSAGNPILGAADYKLVHHASNGRSVYSFCMCPGGTVVAATSEPGRVVTNGMSQYSRNERNANAGIVCGITPQDYPGHPLAGIAFQQHWESRAYELGGSDYSAPGQLVGDFLAGVASSAFGEVLPSYKPGVHLTDLGPSLPEYAITAIRESIPEFEKQIKGFASHDAVLTGVETRTSSPIRIKRRDDDLQSMNVRGLFPAGEGAGYAGGIMSAGIDGIRVAEALALSMLGDTAAKRAA
ncbi:MAG: NAD(P)/FAD-dependent oxidoreductase [Burkholderiales bacterium]|nr:MAG: NAD(P)/FAD-dependent oxidoreductase [Betaproteobacteria bacterium]TAG28917.1 MAG: NAD(P)/FAD-dependent oxidoreductase [Burkholderiales bacterium]